MKVRKKQILILTLLIIATNFLTLAFIAPKVYAVAPTAAWTLLNNLCIQWKDSGGTARCVVYLDASNVLQLGGTGATTVQVNNVLVFGAAVADSSVAGKLFLSSTTANTLKYYDTQGSPALHVLATLNDAQTFTQAQTFSANGIILKGAGSGQATLTYANSGVSQTLTFPAFTDTVAVLGSTQTFTGAITFNSLTFGSAPTLASGATLPAGGLLAVNPGGTVGLGNNQFVNIAGSCGCNGIISATEANEQFLLPVKIVGQNFRVVITTAPGAGTSWTFTLRDNGVNTALACTISGASATSCSDTTDAPAVSAGDKIDIAVTSVGATSASGNWMMSMEARQSG